MKRRMIMAAALCLSLLSLSGCAQQQQEVTQQQPEPIPEQSAPTQSEKPAPAQEQQPVQEPELPQEPVYEIPTGVWLAATDVGYSNYYYFNAEEHSGQFVSLDYGLGMPFSYGGSGKQLIFFLGEEAAAYPAALEENGQDSFKLIWEDNLPETLSFVSEGTLEDFHFYSNDQLAQMAMERYAEEGEDETPPAQYGTMTNEDNTVTVQLYDNLGDHNSTSAWYIVDRFTAMGTDLLTGEEIDLLADEETPVPEEAPVEEEPAEDVPADPTAETPGLPAEDETPLVEGEDVLAKAPEMDPNM